MNREKEWKDILHFGRQVKTQLKKDMFLVFAMF